MRRPGAPFALVPAALLLALVVTTLSACGADAPAPAAVVVSANQAPSARLAAVGPVTARVPVLVDASESVDVDGTIVDVTFTIGDDAVGVAGPRAELVFPADGLWDLTVVVTDDLGAKGRARVRVEVAPAPDADLPQLDPLVLAYDDQALGPLGDLALGGATIAFTLSAHDATSAIAALTVTTDAGPIVDLIIDGEGPSRTLTGRLVLPDADGAVTLEGLATDTYGNVAGLTHVVTVVASARDSDDDGVPDALDGAPLTPNGVEVALYALAEFPRDLLSRQVAEDVVAAVDDGTPLVVETLPFGLLSAASVDGTVAGLALLADAPALPGSWALVLRGRLQGPPATTTLSLAITADDVGVVEIDGTPVASADEEYALNFLRTDRLPAEAGPLFSGASPFAYRVILANEGGPFAFDLDLLFEGPSVTVDGNALPAAAFLLPED